MFCEDVTTGSMADPAVIWEALWSLGQPPNPAGKKWNLNWAEWVRTHVGSCPTELVSIIAHCKLAHCKKTINSLPGTVSKGHSSAKDEFCPPIKSKGILPKERLLSRNKNVYHCLYPTQHQFGAQEKRFSQSLQSKRGLRNESQLIKWTELKAEK